MIRTFRASLPRPLTVLILALVLALGLGQALRAAGICASGPMPCEMGQLMEAEVLQESCTLACGAILLPLAPEAPHPLAKPKPATPQIVLMQSGRAPPPDLRPPIMN